MIGMFSSDGFNLELEVDLYDMNTTVAKIELMERAVNIGIKNAQKSIARRLEKEIRSNLDAYGLGNSDLASGIQVYISDDAITIDMNSDHAIYVEYGTGLKGANDSHPRAEEDGWQYMSGAMVHSDGSWWYPTDRPYEGQKTVVYNGQIYARTFGQASRPYMYKTYIWAKTHCEKILSNAIYYQIRKALKV